MWIALNIVFVFYHTYHITRNNHNSISSWRRNRKKIQANGAIYFFLFFPFLEKKKFTGSPIVREDRSMKIQAYSWRFTLSGTRFCYSVGRKVGAAEEAGSKLHKCESFRAKDGEKIRADCNEDIGNFTVLFLCFSRIAKFSRINSRSIVIVREILEFLRRREESFWKIYPFWTRSNASISDRISRSWNFFFKFLLDKIKMEQGQPDLADKFTEFQGREGHSCIHLAIVSTCISFISFERIILPRTTAIFSSQDARRMSWLSFAMKTRDGYTWVMGGKVEQSIKKESWEGEGNKGKKWSRWLRSFLAKWGITLSCFSLF